MSYHYVISISGRYFCRYLYVLIVKLQLYSLYKIIDLLKISESTLQQNRKNTELISIWIKNISIAFSNWKSFIFFDTVIITFSLFCIFIWKEFNLIEFPCRCCEHRVSYCNLWIMWFSPNSIKYSFCRLIQLFKLSFIKPLTSLS